MWVKRKPTETKAIKFDLVYLVYLVRLHKDFIFSSLLK